MNSPLRTIGPALIAALALGLATAPMWLAPGLSDSYDWWLHLKWQQAFGEALTEGALWPSWVGTVHGGWGAPVFVYYPPLAYYVFAGIAAVGVNAVVLVKTFVSLCLFLLAVATYLVLRRSCGARIAALASAMMVLSPSVLFMAERLNMYPSLLATAALPLVFAAAAGLMRTPTWTMSAAAIATATMAWTHVPTLVMGVAAAAIIGALRFRSAVGEESRSMAALAVGVVLGVGSAAAFLLPAWVARDLIHHDAALRGVWDWRTNFLFDLGVAPQGFRANYVFQSIAVGLSAIAAITTLLVTRHQASASAKSGHVLAWGCIACCLMTTPVSTPLYDVAPVLELLQFPWRWQAPAAVLAVMAVAVALADARINRGALVMLSAYGLLAAALATDLFATNRIIAETRRTSDDDVRWALAGMTADPPEYRTKSMGAAWRRDLLGDRGPTLRPVGPATVTDVMSAHHLRVWMLTTAEPQRIRFQTLCFPGWTLWIDHVSTPTHCGADGVIETEVPKIENARVELRFTGPPLRSAGVAISAACVFLVLVGFITLQRDKQLRS